MRLTQTILHDRPARDKNEAVIDPTRFEALAARAHDLSPAECAALARSAAELVDLSALDRSGAGSFELLWRDDHSEGWLNTWWEPRDTGFHDHGGSCVGVHVLGGLSPSRRARRRRPAARHRLSSRRVVLVSGHRHPSHGARARGGDDPRLLPAAQRRSGTTTSSTASCTGTPGRPDEISPPSPALTASLNPEGDV